MLDARIRDLIVAARAFARTQGINADFTLLRERSSLIRLGNSSIALSTSEELTRLYITVIEGRREGGFGLVADLTSTKELEDAVRRAHEICRAGPEKDYDPIFGVVQEDVDDSTGFDPALEALDPVVKGELCARVIERIKPRGAYDFSGSWSSGSSEKYYTSTANDREGYRRLTDSKLVLVLKEQNRKWELAFEEGGKDAGAFTAEGIIAHFEQLLPIYERSEPYRPPLGHHRIVFGPQAIAEMVIITSWAGLQGFSWEEKRAFTSDNKPGDRIFGEFVTLTDDPADPNVYGLPFDFSGIRRRRFPLVEKGILRAIMYDAMTAAKYHKPLTGHNVGSLDLVLAPGAAPAGLDAGLQFAGDGLYIPMLHYNRTIDPSRGTFTGSSRFNAQQLAGGKLVAPLYSTRITDTIPNVFNHILAVSSRSVLCDMSHTYGPRSPFGISVPEYIVCEGVRVSDVAEGF